MLFKSKKQQAKVMGFVIGKEQNGDKLPKVGYEEGLAKSGRKYIEDKERKEMQNIVKTWTDKQLIDEYENKKDIVNQLTSIDYRLFSNVRREMAIRNIKAPAILSKTDRNEYEAYKNVSTTLKSAVNRLGYDEVAKQYSILVGRNISVIELKKMLE